MADQVISLEVSERGIVQARRLSDNAPSPRATINYRGLDKELIELFEGWLNLRDRQWRAPELRVFGSLLHRCMFNDELWFWVQAAIDETHESGGRLRIELVFPPDPPYSRLSAVPWEFLYRPDQATRQGSFLAADPEIVLSRRIKSAAGRNRAFAPAENLRVLVAVSRPDDRRLEPVLYEDVLAAIEGTCDVLGFELSVVLDPTAAELGAALATGDERPQLLHFMGHGEFDPGQGHGALALRDPEGGADWVDDRRLAEQLTAHGPGPRAVVLHCCEGGRADFGMGFAGVAAQLIRSGVQCVVAMQYAVTNETAISFSNSLYGELATGADLDVAVQSARSAIAREGIPPDPRLLGVPVVYLQDHTALLAAKTVDAHNRIERP